MRFVPSAFGASTLIVSLATHVLGGGWASDTEDAYCEVVTVTSLGPWEWAPAANMDRLTWTQSAGAHTSPTSGSESVTDWEEWGGEPTTTRPLSPASGQENGDSMARMGWRDNKLPFPSLWLAFSHSLGGDGATPRRPLSGKGRRLGGLGPEHNYESLQITPKSILMDSFTQDILLEFHFDHDDQYHHPQDYDDDHCPYHNNSLYYNDNYDKHYSYHNDDNIQTFLDNHHS